MHSKHPFFSPVSSFKFPSKIPSFHQRGRMVKPKQHSTTPMITRKRVLIFSLLFLSVVLLLLSTALQPRTPPPLVHHHLHAEIPHHLAATVSATNKHPEWYDVVLRHTALRRLKVGLVNAELDGLNQLPGELADLVNVEFERVSSELGWAQIFPEWINEGRPKCPEIPMPEFGRFRGLDVVVGTVPCGGVNGTSREGVRDVSRLQVNLAVANLAVESRGGGSGGGGEEAAPVYVVFIGGCEPMWEIFRCDDLIWKKGGYMVYRPNLAKLRHKVLMPIGTCDLARPSFDQSEESKQSNSVTPSKLHHRRPREAYVTVLHSSEHYVCGAIALAQSILQTNTTRDLVLLADNSISPRSIQGLSDAGWKIKRIKRIRSPHAKLKAYNEWNYSKLRVWQLTDYDKIIFIDADFIVLHNLDHFFSYPQLSAAANNKWLFNSGIMVIEPSQCFFEKLMVKRLELDSYNGGDQGFLNEVFTWWHRVTIKLNYLKIYMTERDSRAVPDDRLTIHYLGLKPWVCYKDYDCNWDIRNRQRFASDAAHGRWWRVYEKMPKRLKPFCGLTEKMDARIKKSRKKARDGNFPDRHWRIVVKDRRQHHFVGK